MTQILRIGHLGLLSSAPLFYAQEQGFFETEGLQIVLTHELGISALLEKIAEGRLDAACVPALVPLMQPLGKAGSGLDWKVDTIFTRQGYGLALTQKAVEQLPPHRRINLPTLRIGVPTGATPAPMLVRRWYQQQAQRNLPEPKCIPVPGSEILNFLAEDVIDGFCASDPIPAAAAATGQVVLVSDSQALAPNHLGHVLAGSALSPFAFAMTRRSLHRAIDPALAYCADPRNRRDLLSLVLRAGKRYRLESLLAATIADPTADLPLTTEFLLPGKRRFGPDIEFSLLEESCYAALSGTPQRAAVSSRIKHHYGAARVTS